ncbi:hypothetical protein NLG97_g3243 [Lecanicillium saksenae]|uniref:Uncharacterized protein n=1 Tax=Lecanicillium saksenae TaxID=468837 RepID=A0ACC1R1W6_9HYPO|nr:hypothetical protein NLG97_g3243 [Lecanicillium saksenae]
MQTASSRIHQEVVRLAWSSPEREETSTTVTLGKCLALPGPFVRRGTAFHLQTRSSAAPGAPAAVRPSSTPSSSTLKNGFCAYVASVLTTRLGAEFSHRPEPLNSQAPPPSSTQQPTAPAPTTTTPVPTTNAHLVHFPPATRLTATGCWCPNPSQPRPHYWRTCTRFIPQPIILPSSVVSLCPHPPSSPTASTSTYVYRPHEPPAPAAIEHLFCFDPLAAAASYMQWLLAIPGPPSTPPDEGDAAYLGRWLIECYYTDEHYRAHRVQNPYLTQLDPDTGRLVHEARWEEVPATDEVAHAHYRLLSRFFMELREEPPRSTRAGCWFDAERVHRIINWDRLGVQETMDVFLPFMLQAKSQRLEGIPAR